jgi:catechol 2,3-dioxygenase-like lactoylglutathione lyase family enzyme
METYNAGNAHLCVVVDDLEGELVRLERELGVTGVDAVEIPWGPYAGGRGCYLRDPDDISIQLMQLPLDGPRFAAQLPAIT